MTSTNAITLIFAPEGALIFPAFNFSELSIDGCRYAEISLLAAKTIEFLNVCGLEGIFYRFGRLERGAFVAHTNDETTCYCRHYIAAEERYIDGLVWTLKGVV